MSLYGELQQMVNISIWNKKSTTEKDRDIRLYATCYMEN